MPSSSFLQLGEFHILRHSYPGVINEKVKNGKGRLRSGPWSWKEQVGWSFCLATTLSANEGTAAMLSFICYA